MVGRWFSPEPNVYQGNFDDGARLLAYDVFAYCANNPVNYIDQTGEFIVAAIVVGAIAGGLIGGSVGGTIAYNGAKETGKTGSDLFWSTAGGIGKGAVIGGVGGGLIGATGGVVAAYGATSVAGTATITGTATIAGKATEVTALQIKKSTSEGNSGWQTANNTMSSVFSNGGKIVGLTPITKTGGTVASWWFNDMTKPQYKVVPLRFQTFLNSPAGKVFPYIGPTYAWYHTGISIFSSDPVVRATQRGYTLR